MDKYISDHPRSHYHKIASGDLEFDITCENLDSSREKVKNDVANLAFGTLMAKDSTLFESHDIDQILSGYKSRNTRKRSKEDLSK